jgi:hypothetical protein
MVVVILLNYNKTKYTLECVDSILKSADCDFKVIVVDNNSETDEYKLLQTITDERVIIKKSDINRGYSGGINYGLEFAKLLNPGYYLIMNNDTIIDKFAVKELISTSKKYDDKCIVSGKVYNMDEPDTLQYIGQWCRNYKKFDYPPYIRDLKEKDTGQYDTEMEMEMLDDIFWLLPAAVFTQVGNYCDYFFLYGEQNDYVLRAKKLGLKMIYTPKAKIWHYQHLSVTDDDQKSQRIAYWTYFGVLLLVYLHLSVLDFFKFYTVNFIKLVVKSIIQFGSTKQKTVSQPMLYAYFYFTIWLFNKKPNKGFNPYSNIR